MLMKLRDVKAEWKRLRKGGSGWYLIYDGDQFGYVCRSTDPQFSFEGHIFEWDNDDAARRRGRVNRSVTGPLVFCMEFLENRLRELIAADIRVRVSGRSRVSKGQAIRIVENPDW